MSIEKNCGCAEHLERIDEGKKNMPSTDELTKVSTFFKVIGDLTRVRMLCLLQSGELCVCDIAQVLEMTKSAISHQLSTLKKAGLVKSRREGKNIYYSLDDDHVELVLDIAFTHMRHLGKCDGKCSCGEC